MRQPKVFLQVRDATDNPVAADVKVVRRGMQVGSGSISTLVNSPDPGALLSGDACWVLRGGAILSGVTVTLVGDPQYDPDLRYWTCSTSVVGSWTPAEFDRLVLNASVAAHEVNIYDDPIAAGTPVTQPVTLGTNGIFEQWAQHSGYDVQITDGAEVKYVVGETDEYRTFVSPEEFGAVGDGVTNDSAAVQAAMDYAHSIGGLHVRCLPKVYRVGDLVIRRGVNVSGANVYRSAADQRYRGTMFVSPRAGVINGVIYGLGSDSSQESGDRLRGFMFEHITFANAWLEDDWTTPISAPDNKPIVLIEDAARAVFHECEFTHADRRAMILRGVWDSRFNHCRFMESGNDLVELGSGYATTYMTDSISGTGYSCNQLFFTDCVWESNADLAIQADGANPNELSFQNCKVESATGNGTIASFTNCTALSFDFFQTTTAFDDVTQSAIVFNNCKTCHGSLFVEHITGSGNQLDHYVELIGSEYNDLTVMQYGNDQSVNGIVGDDQDYLNTTRVVHNGTPTATHAVTKHPDATVNAFEVDTGEVSVLLRRRDKSTYHWLGRLEDDGAGGAVYKHMANGNVAYRVLADGTLMLNRPLNFFGGGTFDPDGLKGWFNKEMYTTSKDGVDIQPTNALNIFGNWDPVARTSTQDVGEGRLLIRASQTGGGVLRFSGTIVAPDGTTSSSSEDVSITDTTGALPTDASGVAYPNQTNMYLTDSVFRGTVTVSTVSGTASLLGMYPVMMDDWFDGVTTGRNIHVNNFRFNAWCEDSGSSPIMRAHVMIFDYDSATKKISCSTHVEALLTGTAAGQRLSTERLVNDDILDERLKILAFCYHDGLNSFGAHWNAYGAYLNGDYELV